jgi:diketogulonate reductase-like aldo/keto reductase
MSVYSSTSNIFCKRTKLTTQGYVVIPKSVSEERIISNSEVFGFELSPSEMEEVCDRHLRLEAMLTPLARWSGRAPRH